MMQQQQQQPSAEVLVAVKDAEIGMLRQQLAQLSSDLERNFLSTAARQAAADEDSAAVAALTALLAEKDALFSSYEAQVAALEALRQKEAAECKALQAALDSSKLDCHQKLQAEAAKCEALEQRLRQEREDCAAQLMSARQAAANQTAQHSTHFHAELERAAGQHKQLQQQVQGLQDSLAAKESELGAAQMQLASALASSKRVQDSHAQTIAAKGALVSQMQEELKHLKAGHSQANKAHEAHIAQLITSIKEMQELCANQAAELQQYAAAQKGMQDQHKARQRALEQKEEACSKAEMRRAAMESALQSEITSHAAVKAQHSILLDTLASLLADVQHQHSGAQALVAQLSCQLAEAQEQLVAAAAAGCHQASPQKAHTISELEAQCQGLSTDLMLAENQAACLGSILTQLQSQLMLILPSNTVQHSGVPAYSPRHVAAAALSPIRPAAWPPASPHPQTCTAALAQSLQQQQQQHSFQQQQWQEQRQEQHQQQQPGHNYTPDRGTASSPAQRQAHSSAQHSWAAETMQQQQQQQYTVLGTPQRTLNPHSPGSCGGITYSPSRVTIPVATAATAGCVSAHTPPQQPLSGLVCQLQAGVARLEQQLGASQQQLLGQHPQPAAPPFSPPPPQPGNMTDYSNCYLSAPAEEATPPVARQFGEQLTPQRHKQRHAVPAAPPPHCDLTSHEASMAAPVAGSTCSNCGSSMSALSCSAEVAAAVAVARRRLEQQLRAEGVHAPQAPRRSSKHTAAGAQATAGTPQHAAAASGKRRSHRKPKQREVGGHAVCANADHTAELAALANAALTKLEQLSAEGTTKWG